MYLPVCKKRESAVVKEALLEILLIVLKAKAFQHVSCSRVGQILDWRLGELLTQLQRERKIKITDKIINLRLVV